MMSMNTNWTTIEVATGRASDEVSEFLASRPEQRQREGKEVAEQWQVVVEGGAVRAVEVKMRRPALWLESPNAPTHCAYAPGNPHSRALGFGARDAVARFALMRVWPIMEILAPSDVRPDP